MRVVSTETMVKQLEGLLSTEDLSDWEAEFVIKCQELREAKRLTFLSGKQVEKLEEIFKKHFA